MDEDVPATPPIDPRERWPSESWEKWRPGDGWKGNGERHVKDSRIPLETVIAALKATNGNVSETAKRLGYSRAGLAARIRRDPELKQVIKDCRETIVDIAESALLVAVTKGQQWAVQFALKTIGRRRGYREQVDVQPVGGQVHVHEEIVDVTPVEVIEQKNTPDAAPESAVLPGPIVDERTQTDQRTAP